MAGRQVRPERASRRSPDSDARAGQGDQGTGSPRSEEHTSELQSLMRISYAVFCLKKKKNKKKKLIQPIQNKTKKSPTYRHISHEDKSHDKQHTIHNN